MPRNKKEGIIFGVCMCFIMVFFMGMLNISIHHGRFDQEIMMICLKAFPITFIIAFILEGAVVGKINGMLLAKFSGEKDSVNAILGGDNLSIITREFFIRWPRNFCAAFFLNILVAGPVSRFILRKIQNNSDTDNNQAVSA